MERIQYQTGEINARVEKQFGFHKTLLWEISGRKQDRIKGYKEWRIFMAEVTKNGGSLAQIVEIAEKVTLGLHNQNDKNS